MRIVDFPFVAFEDCIGRAQDRQETRLPVAVIGRDASGVIADEVAIGEQQDDGVPIAPLPGKRAGDRTVFGDSFGESPGLPVRSGS